MNRGIKDLAAGCNLCRISLSRNSVKVYGRYCNYLPLKRLCILDRIDTKCYNYSVIDYSVIIESEALMWLSGTIHLMIRS